MYNLFLKSDLRGRMKKMRYCYYPPIACTILQYCQELILVAVFSYYTVDRNAGTILTAISNSKFIYLIFSFQVLCYFLFLISLPICQYIKHLFPFFLYVTFFFT
jgi:hypothetical protein